jgi:hypothetical protein
MKKYGMVVLTLLALSGLAGCGPKEAETPPGALEPRKMVRPDGMTNPRALSPDAQADMRKRMGR